MFFVCHCSRLSLSLSSMRKGEKVFHIFFMLFLCACTLQAKDSNSKLVMRRIFDYASLHDTTVGDKTSYSYVKYNIKTNRRNAILLSVPTMFAIAHGGDREHMGESYDRVEYDNASGRMKITNMLERTTIPHRRKVMPVLLKYIFPNIYNETLIEKHILSPMCWKNRKYYRYHVTLMYDGTAIVRFIPRVDNTQLVKGMAVADAASGRIIKMNIEGEYDMVRFGMDIFMSADTLQTRIPEKCNVNARFKFMGNDISADYTSVHGLSYMPDDSVTIKGDTILLAKVRPVELTPHEHDIFSRIYPKNDSTLSIDKKEKKKQTFSKMLWDNVGEHLMGRIQSNFGSNNRGHLRINPLLNPLYFGYSDRKGLVYKMDVRGSYYFSENSMIQMWLKAGYSFKQKQLYTELPVTYYFNRQRNGYIEIKVGNGNRITNSTVADAIKHENPDSIDWNNMNLKYFKDLRYSAVVNYDISPRFGIQAGLMGHRRKAIDKKAFVATGMPTTYTSVSPIVELQYRPRGYLGPVFTIDYERSIKGFMNANLEYERCEIDGQYIHHFSILNSLQMRVGAGFYTHKDDGWIFLDYTNFRDDNIPGGWYDDWACNFELLHSNWYNASEYYIRTHVAYESPMLVLSWLPFLGHFIEKERLYASALSVRHLHPYMEYGYGFATRLFSAGIFVAQRNTKFDGFGIKLGFELFRKW